MRKHCTKCGVEKPRTRDYFYSDKRHQDGLKSECKKCHSIIGRAWQKKNRKKYNKQKRKHYQENKEKQAEYSKKYRKSFRGYVINLADNIKNRCVNPKQKKYKYYGGRGIKCLFTYDELYAWLTIKNIDPRGKDIHRINNDGDYTLDNIIFLSRNEHAKLHKKERLG